MRHRSQNGLCSPSGGLWRRLADIGDCIAPNWQEIYDVLDLNMTIAGAAVSALSVTLASQSGRTTLRMFDPVPRGFVI